MWCFPLRSNISTLVLWVNRSLFETSTGLKLNNPNMWCCVVFKVFIVLNVLLATSQLLLVSLFFANAHLGVQIVMLELINRIPVQQHLASLREVEIFQQTHTGALSTAWRPHQGSHLSGLQSERHSLQKETYSRNSLLKIINKSDLLDNLLYGYYLAKHSIRFS